jgi:hypothetical protein
MKLLQIKLDSGLQMRANINQHVVDDYCDALLEGSKFPPVVLFHDGTTYHLADGWTRYFAHKKAGFEIIEADVREGTRRDAMVYALSANSTNGQCRSPEDKRKAVMTVFDDFEWSEKSDREIAKMCAVSHVFVSKLRKAAGKQPDVIAVSRGDQEFKVNNPKKEVTDAPDDEKDYIFDELTSTVQELAEENKVLEARVAVAAMEATDEEKQAAGVLIADLQATIKTLEADNRVLKASRDSFQAECLEAKKQATYGKRRYEKAEKELELMAKQMKIWKDRAETAEAHLAING